MDREFRILMRGAGDIATGSLHRLFQAGFRPIALETDHPSAIRRQVAFSECIYDGETVVEQVHAVLVSSLEEAQTEKRNGRIPVLIDPAGDCIERYCPDVLIDAILAKKKSWNQAGDGGLHHWAGTGIYSGRGCGLCD